MLHGGPTAIAVQKIGVQIEAFTFMIVGGLMQAVTITVGKHYGAKDMDQIPKVFRAAWQMAFGVGLITTFMFLLIPETLFSIFVPEKESILMGKNYLNILAISRCLCVWRWLLRQVFMVLVRHRFLQL